VCISKVYTGACVSTAFLSIRSEYVKGSVENIHTGLLVGYTGLLCKCVLSVNSTSLSRSACGDYEGSYYLLLPYYLCIHHSFQNICRSLLRMCGAHLCVCVVRDYYKGSYSVCIQGSFDNMRRALWRIYTQGSFENICMALLRIYRALLYVYVVRDYYKVSYYVYVQGSFENVYRAL